MNYFLSLILSNIPGSTERMEVIKGVEKQCLVIPIDSGQLIRMRNGGLKIKVRLNECESDGSTKTHKAKLMFRSFSEAKKYKDTRVGTLVKNIGAMYLDYDKENFREQLDMENRKSTDVLIKFRIFLDVIQPSSIRRDPVSNRRYVEAYLRKREFLDNARHTHDIIVKYGESEYQIGIGTEQDTKELDNAPKTEPMPQNKNNNIKNEDYDW